MQLVIPGILAFCATFIITPLIIILARRWHLVDDPRLRKHPANTHTGIIPRAGGLALLFGIVLAAFAFLPLSKAIVGILLAATLTTFVGLWDDWRDTSPYLRFFINIIVALIVVGVGVGIPYITNPLGGIIPLNTWHITFTFWGDTHTVLVWADLFAVLWIVWTMNIVGWSSGVDGQMPGFVGIAAIVLGILSLRFSAHDLSQLTVASLSFITAGAFLGFLPWNFFPQKIMPGYGGKTLAGLMLATLAILSGGKVGSALLILAVPMIDAVYILFRRLAYKKSPFRADRAHFHHHLLDLGWGKRRIALFYWGVSAILGVLTLTLDSKQKVFAFLLVAVSSGGIYLWIQNTLKQYQRP